MTGCDLFLAPYTCTNDEILMKNAPYKYLNISARSLKKCWNPAWICGLKMCGNPVYDWESEHVCEKEMVLFNDIWSQWGRLKVTICNHQGDSLLAASCLIWWFGSWEKVWLYMTLTLNVLIETSVRPVRPLNSTNQTSMGTISVIPGVI